MHMQLLKVLVDSSPFVVERLKALLFYVWGLCGFRLSSYKSTCARFREVQEIQNSFRFVWLLVG